MESNHEDHEEHKDEDQINVTWFLRVLRVLRGETIFAVKCKT